MSTLRLPVRTSLAIFVALSASSLSCSVLIETKTTQCSVDTDCPSLGAAFANAICRNNLCVEKASGPLGCVEPTRSSEPQVTLSFNVSFAAPPAQPHPFTIKGCAHLDLECSAPVAGPLEVPYGQRAELKVPTGFDGVLEIQNPDGLPALEFLGRPIMQDTHGYDLVLVTPATVQLLLKLTQQEYDPNGGVLVVTTRDCDRQPLAGVQVMNSLGGVGFYFQQMLPQKTLTETTTEGSAGFVNVPTGVVSVSATLAGRPLTANSASSRGGWVSYVEVFP